MKDIRRKYTLEEWIDLLISNLIGGELNSETEHNKWHLIALMIPLVEKNYNLLHSSAIGTMLYGDATPFGFEITKPLAATKLVKCLRNQPDVISFNLLNEKYTDSGNTAAMLKDYMFGGSIYSKREEVASGVSLVFWTKGGLQLKTVNKRGKRMTSDSAFLDRIYCFIPGFDANEGTPKIWPGNSSLFNDLLSYFKEARQEDLTGIIDNHFQFGKDFLARDKNAIKKTVSGLVKLLFPDGKYDKEDLRRCLEYAISGRQLIRDHLYLLNPVEYNIAKLDYSEL